LPNKTADGTLSRSKIASIREICNFPEAEFTKPAEALDLPVRDGYARPTLVGLNVFLIERAQQFPRCWEFGPRTRCWAKRRSPGCG
jgi:hypothetical protein